jgi:hypothetical protein
MCLLTFDVNSWDSVSALYQYYENDRTLFPRTIVNPRKFFYDTTFVTDSNDARNHKWDWNGCHSVVPYADYILTIDEFSSWPSWKENGVFLDGPFELLDFYPPDSIGFDWGTYSDTLKEPASHRLNYLHRNRPGRLGVDPNKFQGAFLRIWDRSKLFSNDTAVINNTGAIVNAYDVQESPDHPEGYVGVGNIPETCIVPNGFHEPIMIGNRVYLGGYTTGARVLDIDGADIRVKAYCRTEDYLSNDPDSALFYGYAGNYYLGPYRLFPADGETQVLFGYDVERGTWVYRLFDSLLTGNIPCCNSIQPAIEIGTVEATRPMTFTVKDSLAVPPCDSVCFVENTTFVSDNNAVIAVEGQLSLQQTAFRDPITFLVRSGGKIVVLPGTNLALDTGQTIDAQDGTVEIRSGATLTLHGGTLRGGPGGTFIFEDSLALRGGGTLTAANVILKKGLHTTPDMSLLFTGGGHIELPCDSANWAHCILNRGRMEFLGCDSPYVFGNCVERIINQDSAVWIADSGTTLQNLCAVSSIVRARLESIGTADHPCNWLARDQCGIDNYASFTARHTTFGGSTLYGSPQQWQGIFSGSDTSVLDFENCTVQDVNINNAYCVAGIHFYGAPSSGNRIVRCNILRDAQTRDGSGVLLQRGATYSYASLECNTIGSMWGSGVTGAGSTGILTGNTITQNGYGVTASGNAIFRMRRNCVESQIEGGMSVDGSMAAFFVQYGMPGENRIVENANRQIDLVNASLLIAGENQYTGYWEGHWNNISHSDSTVTRVRLDNGSVAYMQYNWYGTPPDIQSGPGCEYSDGLWLTMFNMLPNYRPYYVLCSSILDQCQTECGGQGFRGAVASLSKAAVPTPYASSLYDLRAYALAGNFAEVYRYAGAAIPANAAHEAAWRTAMFLSNLEREQVMRHPDSLAVSRSRLEAFLLGKIAAAGQPSTHAALSNALARALMGMDDAQGAMTRIQQLRAQFASSPYAANILPIRQLAAMALCDSAVMNASIAEMITAGFSASDLRLARALRVGYLRNRVRTVTPKITAPDIGSVRFEGAGAFAVHCYPNPFNPGTAIEYTLPSDTRVTLNVYTIHGRKVATLVNEDQAPGLHTAVFMPDASAASGMYFYVLTTPEKSVTGRMALAR